MSQADLAHLLGVNRLKIQRIESSKSEMNFEEWIRFADYFQLTSENIRSGLISIPEKESDKEAFSIPKRLQINPFSKGRILSIHKWNYERLMGEDSFELFCQAEKVNPLYFTNLSGSLNMDFNLRLIESLIMSKKIKSKLDIQNFANLANKQTFHRILMNEISYPDCGVNRISHFIQNDLEKYEKNHSVVIEDIVQKKEESSITVSFSPKEHVNKSLYNLPHLKTFFETFIETYLKSMLNQESRVIKLSSPKSHKDKTTLKLGVVC